MTAFHVQGGRASPAFELADEPDNFSLERVAWLIRLRWFALLGILVGPQVLGWARSDAPVKVLAVIGLAFLFAVITVPLQIWGG